jgi:hypothetical protein
MTTSDSSAVGLQFIAPPADLNQGSQYLGTFLAIPKQTDTRFTEQTTGREFGSGGWTSTLGSPSTWDGLTGRCPRRERRGTEGDRTARCQELRVYTLDTLSTLEKYIDFFFINARLHTTPDASDGAVGASINYKHLAPYRFHGSLMSQRK